MTSERRRRILERLASDTAEEHSTRRMCSVCTDVTGLTGSGIMLASGGVSLGSVCTSNDVSDQLEELQFALGEGPGIEACRSGRPVFEPDLATPSAPRWLAFAPAALALGARAVFGFPIGVGAAQLGALTLYRDQPGPLANEQHADALVLADVVATTILLLQAKATPGQLASELEAGADLHFAVHQASGMVAAQLDLDVADALVRIRAYAFAHDRPLVDVAHAVVNRTLRFDGRAVEQDPT